ncbi:MULTISPECIES: hypothetical protein [unclassified Leptolyngbya]|uniref:hypothetical protein n=1 Tax=unclassified Leptolyngbya TaxID=2650499 RepID=UPI001689BDA2|nr:MULTISPECIES: hypothetical protein [unclassified Leptolyngbya]MBD1910710.1 hypothetical protein [Leptolyngbya sp. FACHB-8]MBD2154307.1 hypothetical protein [Leptolyngbya sp. FACHB-16]
MGEEWKTRSLFIMRSPTLHPELPNRRLYGLYILRENIRLYSSTFWSGRVGVGQSAYHT